jgi:hypothetical protein
LIFSACAVPCKKPRNRALFPVPPGASQEYAEIAYWRRRVVEACIFGVDVNPLAVELSKLSLWLTCIAADEPLNFLDHHLRTGNSLLSASPDDMKHLPLSSEAERKQITFNIGGKLSQAVQAVIAENLQIEETASTEMELVKKKESRWKAVREKLRPFLYFADVWLAALDGLPINELNYQMLARAELEPGELDNKEKSDAKKLRESLATDIETKRKALNPFHWRLEFPDVFFETDGQPRHEAFCGFDAVLGNPTRFCNVFAGTAFIANGNNFFCHCPRCRMINDLLRQPFSCTNKEMAAAHCGIN